MCALALAGCTGGPGPSAPTAAPTAAPTLPAAVTVEVQQLRSDVAGRQAQVHIANGSDEALRVGDVRVDDVRFDGAATRVVPDRVSTIPPGGTVDIRVQLPPVDCTASDDGGPQVVLEIVGDSSSTEVTASASDPVGFLAPLHARECLLERVMDAASLSFTGFTPSPPGQPAVLQLTIAPTGRGAATVVGVERTNLIDFAGTAADEDLRPIGIEVAEGDSVAVNMNLGIVPFRCDPHAVQEDKRGTVFDVRVGVDGQGGEEGEVELFVGEELRGRILSWVAEWCGFGR